MNIHEETLKIARNLIEKDPSLTEWVISKFPELKESEDEIIRKKLITFFQRFPYTNLYDANLNVKDVLAWLEKQGEQKPFFEFKAKDWYVSEVDGKIHNMTYNPTDKVGPKFKVGDWIVQNGLGTYKIVEVCESWYEVISYKDGIQYSIGFDKENDCHLWTIQDAKDGDVLASELCDSIILFRGIKDDNIDFYCDYDFSKIDIPGDRFAVNNGQNYGNVEDSKDFHPATKEQRDALMKAMTDAGYTFDFEKKDLKLLITNGGDFEQKQEWSEEDSYMLGQTIKCVNNSDKLDVSTEEIEDWLKSLRPQPHWKPSKELIRALSEASGIVGMFTPRGTNLQSLYNDLKKLKLN